MNKRTMSEQEFNATLAFMVVITFLLMPVIYIGMYFMWPFVACIMACAMVYSYATCAE